LRRKGEKKDEYDRGRETKKSDEKASTGGNEEMRRHRGYLIMAELRELIITKKWMLCLKYLTVGLR